MKKLLFIGLVGGALFVVGAFLGPPNVALAEDPPHIDNCVLTVFGYCGYPEGNCLGYSDEVRDCECRGLPGSSVCKYDMRSVFYGEDLMGPSLYCSFRSWEPCMWVNHCENENDPEKYGNNCGILIGYCDYRHEFPQLIWSMLWVQTGVGCDETEPQ